MGSTGKGGKESEGSSVVGKEWSKEVGKGKEKEEIVITNLTRPLRGSGGWYENIWVGNFKKNITRMTTKEIANRLVEYCRKGDFEGAQKELYARDVKSIEPYATPEFEKETVGLDAILEKGRKFDAMVEKVHNIEVSEPLVTDNAIAFKSTMDLTMKGQGRMKMGELCVYQVKDGKIVSEEFFV